jgi:ABC-type glycerol-3-phosphate transport system substrate-binding protein
MSAKGLRLVGVFAALLVAAGCGSADGSNAVGTPSARASVSAAAPSSSAPIAAGGSDAAACKTISDSLRLLVSAASRGQDNPGLKEMSGLIKTLRETAPSAIRGDLQVIADFDQKIVDAVLSGRQPEIAETPQLTAAMKHQAEWTATHCGHG